MQGDAQGHSPWPGLLEIDLGAIAANWRALHPGPIAAVVKADAYGLGAPQVAARLYAEGCRHFFVAHPAEAFALRAIVPDAMLAVLNGLWPGHAASLASADLAPVLGSLAEIDEWTARGPGTRAAFAGAAARGYRDEPARPGRPRARYAGR